MCLVCERALKMIETLEQVHDLQEIRRVVREVNPECPLGEKPEMLELIAVLAVKWATKLKIHPNDYFLIMNRAGKAEYEAETVRIMAEKLRNAYESRNN